MTWQDFITAVEADGITPETRLASVHWTARAGLAVQVMPMAEGDLNDGTIVEPEELVTPIYTKHNELGEVEVHD